jgi:hypothetical protein
MTSVVNIRVNNIRPLYDNLAQWMANPNHVYISTRMIVLVANKRFPPKNSMWHNPFSPKSSSLEECHQKYRKYIINKISKEGLIDELLDLDGKVLGCWCKPDACHGDILVELIEYYKKYGKLPDV